VILSWGYCSKHREAVQELYFNRTLKLKLARITKWLRRRLCDNSNTTIDSAPYNPALMLISEVKGSNVYQYDSDATSKWRVATKFAYRRIKTS